MKILIITDIHFGEDTNYPEYNYLKDGEESYISSFGSQFEKFLPKLHLLIREHNLVINLGDLIHETDTKNDLIQYKKARQLLGDEKPVKHVFGNHDLRTLSRDQLIEMIREKKPYYSFDLGGYHHIVLDSFRNSRNELCRIDEKQLSWLKKDLSKTNLSTLVYCHYPLDNQPVDTNYYFKEKPERAFIDNRKEVRSIFELSGKVLAVFNGHLHFFHEENINGIIYVTVPSFTENDGTHNPKTQFLSVSLENKKIHSTVESVTK